ncbi:hypothetical protein [Sphingomonas crocodyli]|uniref:hypothetical protein n=1 Tax=Sphingomonas crocodyli TaxID=1979270 RepID=UPI0013E2EE26|nr:hypothetical protein [Sphingomonas crocodyli]
MTYIPDLLARELNITPFGPGTSKGALLLQEYLNHNGLGSWSMATGARQRREL